MNGKDGNRESFKKKAVLNEYMNNTDYKCLFSKVKFEENNYVEINKKLLDINFQINKISRNLNEDKEINLLAKPKLITIIEPKASFIDYEQLKREKFMRERIRRITLNQDDCFKLYFNNNFKSVKSKLVNYIKENSNFKSKMNNQYLTNNLKQLTSSDFIDEKKFDFNRNESIYSGVGSKEKRVESLSDEEDEFNNLSLEKRLNLSADKINNGSLKNTMKIKNFKNHKTTDNLKTQPNNLDDELLIKNDKKVYEEWCSQLSDRDKNLIYQENQDILKSHYKSDKNNGNSVSKLKTKNHEFIKDKTSTNMYSNGKNFDEGNFPKKIFKFEGNFSTMDQTIYRENCFSEDIPKINRKIPKESKNLKYFNNLSSSSDDQMKSHLEKIERNCKKNNEFLLDVNKKLIKRNVIKKIILKEITNIPNKQSKLDEKINSITNENIDKNSSGRVFEQQESNLEYNPLFNSSSNNTFSKLFNKTTYSNNAKISIGDPLLENLPENKKLCSQINSYTSKENEINYNFSNYYPRNKEEICSTLKNMKTPILNLSNLNSKIKKNSELVNLKSSMENRSINVQKCEMPGKPNSLRNLNSFIDGDDQNRKKLKENIFNGEISNDKIKNKSKKNFEFIIVENYLNNKNQSSSNKLILEKNKQIENEKLNFKERIEDGKSSYKKNENLLKEENNDINELSQHILSNKFNNNMNSLSQLSTTKYTISNSNLKNKNKNMNSNTFSNLTNENNFSSYDNTENFYTIENLDNYLLNTEKNIREQRHLSLDNVRKQHSDNPNCENAIKIVKNCLFSVDRGSKLQDRMNKNLYIKSNIGKTYKIFKNKEMKKKMDLNFVKNIKIEREEKGLFLYGKNKKEKGQFLKTQENSNIGKLDNIGKYDDLSVYRVRDVLMQRFGISVGKVKKKKINFMKNEFAENHKKVKYFLESAHNMNDYLIKKIDKYKELQKEENKT